MEGFDLVWFGQAGFLPNHRKWVSAFSPPTEQAPAQVGFPLT